MDSVNPDYLVVKILNWDAESINAGLSTGTIFLGSGSRS